MRSLAYVRDRGYGAPLWRSCPLNLYALQPTTAPGRDSPTTPTAPAQPVPSAPAAPTGPGDGPMGGLSMILIFLPMILLFFYMSRSQSKKQKDLEASLKAGDRVITQSGLVGRIVDMSETRVKLEIAPGVNVQMLKSALSGLDAGETKAQDGKPKEAGKEKSQEKKA